MSRRVVLRPCRGVIRQLPPRQPSPASSRRGRSREEMLAHCSRNTSLSYFRIRTFVITTSHKAKGISQLGPFITLATPSELPSGEGMNGSTGTKFHPPFLAFSLTGRSLARPPTHGLHRWCVFPLPGPVWGSLETVLAWETAPRGPRVLGTRLLDWPAVTAQVAATVAHSVHMGRQPKARGRPSGVAAAAWRHHRCAC